jgi:hypothetical protein
MRGRFLSTLVLLVALLGGLLSSPIRPAYAQKGICPEVVQLVCTRTKDGRLQTYGNACIARQNGAAVLQDGPCPIFCPTRYEPVCGRKAGTNKTYPNSCYALVAGAAVLAEGPCPGRICPRMFLPVCGVDSAGKLVTYPSRCVALNRGARILHNGKC